MKYVALILSLLLSGCSLSSMSELSKMVRNDKLDQAPQDHTNVRNPQWGQPEQPKKTAEVALSYHSDYDRLIGFLRSNDIAYDVLPGSSMMVHVNESIYFRLNSDTVEMGSYPWIARLSVFLSRYPSITVVINGHTDITGSESLNDDLSERRAERIEALFEMNGVSKSSIYTRGYGEYFPACTNKTASGRACNRRAELLFILNGS